jgi:hypothetical protein
MSNTQGDNNTNSIVRVACIYRSVCKKNAIQLEDRAKSTIAADLW